MMSKKYDIFLSYSRKDMAVVHKVQDDLRAVGLKVWTDEQLEPGTPIWAKAIEEAIRDSRCMVVLLSPEAKESYWVQNEILFAERHDVGLFPLVIEGDDMEEIIPISLISRQYIDARRDYGTAIKKLIRAITKQLEKEPFEPETEITTKQVEAAIERLDNVKRLSSLALFAAIISAVVPIIPILIQIASQDGTENDSAVWLSVTTLALVLLASTSVGTFIIQLYNRIRMERKLEALKLIQQEKRQKEEAFDKRIDPLLRNKV